MNKIYTIINYNIKRETQYISINKNKFDIKINFKYFKF